MGWCSGTVIFDGVLDEVLKKDGKPDVEAVVRTLVAALEDGDWDCQQDSEYWSHPIVRKVMKDLHPDWGWSEEEV